MPSSSIPSLELPSACSPLPLQCGNTPEPGAFLLLGREEGSPHPQPSSLQAGFLAAQSGCVGKGETTPFTSLGSSSPLNQPLSCPFQNKHVCVYARVHTHTCTHMHTPKNTVVIQRGLIFGYRTTYISR